MLIQENKINVELKKKIMTGKKSTLLSFRNQDWKKVLVEIKKVNKLIPNILTDNITKLNELIYAAAKPVCDKIGVPLRNQTEIQILDGKLG